ncbi:MAG TPA: aminodeoxychorismate/anthranilate synthase component II [Fulvivirga sp.]|nr:aminodeoxychorismate/anthranilate synthase component II [Fulvivirga sp.]
MVLLLDNFDSFTYNLVDYFAQLDIDCNVVRNDVPIEKIKTMPIEAIVISPGPQTPSKAGCLMALINEYHNKIPILGICLGHQAIGEYFGMKLVKAPKPRHGKITSVRHGSDVIFNGIPLDFNVVQYNSLILEVPEVEELQIIASGNGDQVMAVRHKSLPIWGLQFHPEAALTEYGLQLLKNWLDYNKLGI